jgi:ApaG protein
MIESPYKAMTHGFLVEVFPLFVPEESDYDSRYYLFSYEVKITNLSDRPAKLVKRQWKIVDGQKNKQVIEGDGVVGQSPIIESGETFTYKSFCPLKTPTGSMRGTYLMQDVSGELFTIEVPVFFFRVVDQITNLMGLYQAVQE